MRPRLLRRRPESVPGAGRSAALRPPPGTLPSARDAGAGVAFSVPRAVFVPTPPFSTLKPSGGSFDERYYVRCAETIVEAVLPQLRPAPVTSAAHR